MKAKLKNNSSKPFLLSRNHVASFTLFVCFCMAVFHNELTNARQSFTIPPPICKIGDNLLPQKTIGKSFKNVDHINNMYCSNNTSRPKDLIIYKDTFLTNSNDAASGQKRAFYLKDESIDLRNAIYCNNFNDVLFSKSQFHTQFLGECFFIDATFDSVTFINCQFIFCDFSNAIINTSVSFKNCSFFECSFRNTQFSPALEGSLEINNCDMFHCRFIPGNFSDVALTWKGNYNIYYINDPDTILKSKLNKQGLKDDIKYLEAAEKKNRLARYANSQTRFTQHLLLGNFLNDYGTNPLKPLLPIVILLPLFFFIYLKMSFNPCIFLTWNGSFRNKGGTNTYTVDVNRLVQISRTQRFGAIIAFTIISCFTFGFSLIKGLDFQTIITAFQRRNVAFNSEGTVKLLTGIQSLLVFLCFTLSIIALL